MKKILNIFVILLAVSFFYACEEEEREPVVIPGDHPVLTVPATVVLEKLNAETNKIEFSWTKADYGFQSATSYLLQIDVAGNNFSGPANIITTSDTLAQITQLQLNTKLQGIGIPVSTATDVEVRVIAYVSQYVDSLYSAVVPMNITLYSTTYPSIYMIGAATGGWDTNKAVEVASTGEPYKYTTIAYFDATNGSNWRFFSSPAWNASLGGYDKFTVYPTDLLAPATSDGDPNFNFIGEKGWYEMTVNTQTGTITMTATTEPVMYLTGDATHGWNWDDPVTQIFWVGYKIWEGDVNFVSQNAFRIFMQKDWGPVSYGYTTITNYDTNYIDVMAGHSDPNWQFKKPSGKYHVKVDLRQSSIVITEI